MADEKKATYPFVNKKNWFALRKQFQRVLPTQVTLSYLANALDISEESARANVLGGLKLTGIVDGDGKTTQRASQWRDDEQYPSVCVEIWQELYPEELKALAPDSTTPQDRIGRWFANKLGAGESSANKLAAFYRLLQDADPAKENEGGRASSGTRASKTPKPSKRVSKKTEPVATTPVADLPATPEQVEIKMPSSEDKRSRPSLHIDVQIHISPESSAEQIEQIFASMAKHLKDI